MATTPPASTLRDGNLKATIWQNEGEKGAYYSTTLSRTYKDEDGKLHDTQSFRPSDLLRVSELAREAHDETNSLRRRDFEATRDVDEDRAEHVKQRLQNNRASRDQSRNSHRER